MTLRQAAGDFYEEQEYKGNSPATIAFCRTDFGHVRRWTRMRVGVPRTWGSWTWNDAWGTPR